MVCSFVSLFLTKRLIFMFRKSPSWLQDVSLNRSDPSYLYIGTRSNLMYKNVFLQGKKLDFWIDVLNTARLPPS